MAAIANQFIIRHVDPSSPDFMYSANLWDVSFVAKSVFSYNLLNSSVELNVDKENIENISSVTF